MNDVNEKDEHDTCDDYDSEEEWVGSEENQMEHLIGDDGQINKRILKHLVNGDIKMYVVQGDEIQGINVDREGYDEDVLLDYVGEWLRQNVIENILKNRVKVYLVKNREVYSLK